jgi:hypothetical protein
MAVDADGVLRINYRPRRQFMPFHARKQRFACLVCHRRAGKTLASVHELQRGALSCRLSNPRFAYVAPFRAQAKAIVWTYLLEAIEPLRALKQPPTAHESELRVDYPHNGGQVRLYGADNPDALRGIYLDGVVLDEFADMDPRTWTEVISPALSDRKGWAVFIGTPRGKNEFWRVWFDAQDNPDWYTMMLPASRSDILPAEELAIQKKNLTEDQYAQEYECSFDAAVQGTYYGRLMVEAEAQGRICSVPYDRATLVWTSWDLGIGDKTAIWFCQVVGREIHLIDYYEAAGVDVAHYVSKLREKPYEYGGHFLPHDAEAREKGTGQTYMDHLRNLDVRNTSIVPLLRVEQRINAARLMLGRCWFDAVKCKQGLECLRMYRSEYDDKRKVFRNTPLHDWAIDGADSFGYLALAIDKRVAMAKFNQPIKYPELGLV